MKSIKQKESKEDLIPNLRISVYNRFDPTPKGGGELRGQDEGRQIDPTRRTGELDCIFDPTRRTGELDGLLDLTHPFGELDLLDPTRRTGELVGASGPTCPFGELDDGCFAVRDPLSRIRCPRP
ncbi:hypothetical protein F2Q70_00017601 [Brassica cretica]|uniref:Uncharacterized protein n=1 Tax=Brassica cretica TaxID=69181 RepID=A0A8S9KSI6_BRACR|nr:hypothetical protein F2Q70_00017601 [Brassica cretica]KAF2597032.1 hypothetical protein F2Q68_00010539 [Brassica cretica]